MTKTFSFETPVNDGKTFIGNLLITGVSDSVSQYEILHIWFTPFTMTDKQTINILPLLKAAGATTVLTHIPVTAHLIKLWGEQEPEAFTENQKG